VVFVLGGALTVIGTIITYSAGLVVIRSSQRMAGQTQILRQLISLESTLADAETGQRGFLLTGDSRYLDPYVSAISRIRTNQIDLQRTAAAGELPANNVDQLIRLSNLKMEELDQTVQIRKTKGLQAALAIMRTDRGKQIMDQCRAEIAAAQSQVQTTYDAASRRVSVAIVARDFIFAILVAANLSFLLWAYRKISFQNADTLAASAEAFRQKELFAAALAGIGEGVLVTDAVGKCLLLNEEAERLTGWTKSEVVGRRLGDFYQVVHGKSLQPVQSPVEIVLQTGKAVASSEDAVLLAKSGKKTSVDSNARPVFKPDGGLANIVLVFRDVTLRRKAEESGQRLAAIIENSGDAILSKDLDGIVQTWNAGAERLFGYTAEEMIGKPILTLFPPDRLTEEDRILDHLRNGKPCEIFETFRLKKGGERVPVSIVVSPLRDHEGQIIGASKIVRDISERKQSEAKLHAQLNRLSLLSQTTRAIAERQDLQSIFLVVLRNLEDQMPVDFATLLVFDPAANLLTVSTVGGKSQEIAEQIELGEGRKIPVDQNGLSKCVWGHLVYEPDVLLTHQLFTERLARAGLRSLVLAPLLVESAVFGVLVAARFEAGAFRSTDCEFLRQLSEHVGLAAHQAHVYAALQAAYDDLRQTQQGVVQHERLSALGQMASGIAHDINNAIVPVAIYTETILETEHGLTPRGREQLEIVRRAVQDVAATVARMREFYRQRDAQPFLERVDVNKLIQQVLDLTRARWSDMPQQRGITIRVQKDLDLESGTIMGAESEIREALTNLIFNAVDAMPDGGTLTVRTRVDNSSSSQNHRRVKIEISDTGVGMSEETRKHCLEPFYTTKGERGTGLGLAMVFGMVQRHSAEIEIESELGKGTLVRLTFAAPAEVSEGGSQPPAGSGVPQRLRLLIVDDDPVLLKSLRDALEMDGHQVIAANGGRECIAAFRQAVEGGLTINAVITDLGMPYVDGRKVAQAVKSFSPKTPVIMLTGWGQRLTSEGDTPEYVDKVLAKPPRLQDLRETLAGLTQPRSDKSEL
jgi:PAS domain S-box-containing protein